MRPLDQQICFTLYATSMAVTRAYKPLLDELGLTYPQYLVLSVLGEAGGLTIGGVAARLDLERGFRSADPNLHIVPVMYVKRPLSSTKTAVTPQHRTKYNTAVPTGYHLDL